MFKDRGFNRVLVFCAFLVFFVILGTMTQSQPVVQAGSSNLKALLEQLNKEVKAGKQIVLLQFIKPIADIENLWTIGDPKDKTRLHISQIGDDYLCLTETSGQAVLTRCVPFNNIASINYLEN